MYDARAINAKNYYILDVPSEIYEFGMKPIVTDPYHPRPGAVLHIDTGTTSNILLRNSRVNTLSRVVSVHWKSETPTAPITVFVSLTTLIQIMPQIERILSKTGIQA